MNKLTTLSNKFITVIKNHKSFIIEMITEIAVLGLASFALFLVFSTKEQGMRSVREISPDDVFLFYCMAVTVMIGVSICLHFLKIDVIKEKNKPVKYKWKEEIVAVIILLICFFIFIFITDQFFSPGYTIPALPKK